eukprot:CAMPEP_0170756206 /NCGR_PEP_ID=MMETSP0437-20130122/13908_1 /TAXON_ID=0 /ORGANISM="Sexangularia sp." /LENGTH=864 /DNA_ID=CAMNT_0011095387 /DNA_START=69 /DNA_END=2663 /DNA_ORIENTATION=+
MFTDPEFPPDSSSLYFSPEHPPKTADPSLIKKWRRISDFCSGPVPSSATSEQKADWKTHLFIDGTEPGDVQQGAIGDCYYLGAFSVIASRPDLLKPLFVDVDEAQGRYRMKFFKGGKWREVEVDDYVPVGANGLPVYARAADIREAWVLIAEKAYAKLHTCYEAIEGGSVTEALVDLTGGAPEEIDLGQTPVDEVWERMLRFQQEEWLMGCSNSVVGGAVEADTGMGILQNHAYGIMQVTRTKSGLRLVKCRNPWGNGAEWTGRFSDKDQASWTPELAAELNFEDADDGIFWIELSDFVKQFNRISGVRLYEDEFGKKWQKHTFNESLTKVAGNSGGCINYPTWTKNPQYLVRVDKPDTDLFIVVSQPDPRGRRDRDPDRAYVHKIGAYVLHANEAHPTTKVSGTLTNDRVEHACVYLNQRGVGTDVKLEPGRSYIIMPSTFEPDVDLDLVLEVYADEDIVMERLEEPVTVSTKGAWSVANDTAGGCMNHPATHWSKNPQWFFTAPPCGGPLSVSLTQEVAPGGTLHHAGLKVYKVSSDQRLIADPQDESALLLNTPITNAPTIGDVVDTQPGASYIVHPFSFEPGKEASFVLTLAGREAPAGGAPVPASEVRALVAAGKWVGLTAGGSPNNRGTWRNSPQFLLEVSAPGSVTLTLSTLVPNTHVGLYVSAFGGRRQLELLVDQVVAQSEFSPSSVALTTTFSSAGTYVVAACTFEPGQEGEFELMAVGDVATGLSLLQDHKAMQRGLWTGERRGGCSNNATWPENPQFLLSLPAGGPVDLVLAQEVGDGATAQGMGFMVFDSAKGLVLPPLAESKLVAFDYVTHTVTLSPGQQVTVVPTLFEAGKEGAFALYAYASTPVTLTT